MNCPKCRKHLDYWPEFSVPAEQPAFAEYEKVRLANHPEEAYE